MSKLDKDISSVQSLSCVPFFVTPWTAAQKSSLSITSSQNLLKLMSTESVIPSNHLIPSCPLLLLLPSIFPGIRVFSSESALCIRQWCACQSLRCGILSLLSFGFPEVHCSEDPILWLAVLGSGFRKVSRHFLCRPSHPQVFRRRASEEQGVCLSCSSQLQHSFPTSAQFI